MADLSTWPGLRTWIAATFRNVTSHGDDLVRFDFGARRILVRRLDGTAPGWVFFGIKVCPAAAIQPMRALELRAFEVGSLAVYDGAVMISQTLPLRGLAPEVVVPTLEALVRGRTAVRMEQAPRTSSGAVFTHYAD